MEIGAEAALFPEKEYINGIFVAVQAGRLLPGDRKGVLFPGYRRIGWSLDACRHAGWFPRHRRIDWSLYPDWQVYPGCIKAGWSQIQADRLVPVYRLAGRSWMHKGRLVPDTGG